MEALNPIRILRIVLAVFITVAGINHFLHPEFYFPLIPDYLPFHDAINSISGVLEIGLGSLLLFRAYQYMAAISICILLILFIPSHVYFIQIGSCVVDGLCTPPWVAWARLLVIHPILVFWAWYVRD